MHLGKYLAILGVLGCLAGFPAGTLAGAASAPAPERPQGALPGDCPPGPEVEAAALLAMLRAGQAVRCQDVVVRGVLDLTTLGDGSAAAVTAPVEIANSQFMDGVMAAGNKDGQVIQVRFDAEVDFRGSTLAGPVSFRQAEFGGGADFSQTVFMDEAAFDDAVFAPGASFQRAQFGSGAFFPLAHFEGSAYFSEAHFAPIADFSLAQFSGDAFFDAAMFDGEAGFSSTQFLGRAIFEKVRFGAGASFSAAHFVGDANFTRAVFVEGVGFAEARFESDAGFRRVGFGGPSSFKEAALGVADFTQAAFTDTVDLAETEYTRWMAQTFDFEKVASADAETELEALRKLEDNFRDQDQLGLANDSFYRRKRLEREAKPAWEQTLETVLFDWPFGYGVRPWRALGVSILLILLFAVAYYPSGVVREAPLAPPKQREARLGLRLAELPLARPGEFPDVEALPTWRPLQRLWRLEWVRRAWRAVWFSFGVFTKLGFGALVAARFQGLVIVEWILGLLMMAGFAYCLAQTVPLLHILFGTLF